ncbi:unnamed protein product [Adineta steineri]|uniref:Sialidase domain-containing protein n=1 Tax=Adineta steineri TaxID=433720 RepID=A0A813Z784_9BILA|nr:unnamed protein product [Adineta steineri]CAF0894844.1 unnamed protein product [Adineta steineri]CAF0963874.1 unnamed protein product [Adineta steineri]
MLLTILLFSIQLTKLTAVIPYDGIIHRSTDGSSYAFLSPPTPTFNHAASIEQLTPSGTLAIAWFTDGEASPNCSIAVSLLEYGSQQFTPGVIITDRVNYTNLNPVLFWDNDTQILHLYHSSQLNGKGEATSQIWHTQSKDRGVTWSIATPFYTVPGAFARNRIIPTLNKLGFIFPCYNSSPDIDYPFILRLSSSTSNLTRIEMKDTDNLIQPTVIRLNNSARLRTFLRDEHGEWIYYLDSNDDGLTWTTPKATSLPNNNAGIEAHTLKSGAIIMAFNNRNGLHKPRTPLTVALSYDNGMTWPYLRDVQIHDDDNSTSIGEYSYPSVLQSFWSGTDDNDIHLAYSYKRQTIKYVRFNEKWIKQG